MDLRNALLVWIGETETTSGTTSQPRPPKAQPVVDQTQPAYIETPPLEPHTPVAARRHLTVMFCDLVGSTEISGQFDPVDYRELVRAYQTPVAT